MHAKLTHPISARANRMKTSHWLFSTIFPSLLLSTTQGQWKNCLPTKSTLTNILSSASSTPCASPAIFSSAVRANRPIRFLRRHGLSCRHIVVSRQRKMQRLFHRYRTGRLRFRAFYRSTIHQPASLVDRHFRALSDSGRYRSSGHRAGQENRSRTFLRLASPSKSRFSRPARITFRRPAH